MLHPCPHSPSSRLRAPSQWSIIAPRPPTTNERLTILDLVKILNRLNEARKVRHAPEQLRQTRRLERHLLLQSNQLRIECAERLLTSISIRSQAFKRQSTHIHNLQKVFDLTRPGMDPREQSFHVGYPADDLGKRVPAVRVLQKVFDGVESGVNSVYVAQRCAEPDAEESFTERRYTAAEKLQERAVGCAVAVRQDLLFNERVLAGVECEWKREWTNEMSKRLAIEDERPVLGASTSTDRVEHVKVAHPEDILIDIELAQIRDRKP